MKRNYNVILRDIESRPAKHPKLDGGHDHVDSGLTINTDTAPRRKRQNTKMFLDNPNIRR